MTACIQINNNLAATAKPCCLLQLQRDDVPDAHPWMMQCAAETERMDGRGCERDMRDESVAGSGTRVCVCVLSASIIGRGKPCLQTVTYTHVMYTHTHAQQTERTDR